MNAKIRGSRWWKKAGVLLAACLITMSGMLSFSAVHGEAPEETGGDVAGGSARGTETVTFHAATALSEVVKGKHYIFVIKNPDSGQYYALAYDSENGNCKPVSLTETPAKDGRSTDYTMEVPAEDVTSGNYVMTATEGYINADPKFKTNYKDENGKTISLKMGQYSGDTDHLFDTSSGAIGFTQTNYNLFRISHSTYAVLRLREKEGQMEFIHYYTYPYSSLDVLILTDATEKDVEDAMNSSSPSGPSAPETIYSGVQPFGTVDLSVFYLSPQRDILVTFVDADGKRQAITANGIKEMPESNEDGCILTDVANTWKQCREHEIVQDSLLVSERLDGLKKGNVYFDVNSSTFVSGEQTEVKLLGALQGDYNQIGPYLTNSNGKFMKWDSATSSPVWVDDYQDATPLQLYSIRQDLAAENYHRVTNLAGIRDWKKILITYKDADGNYQLVRPDTNQGLLSVAVATSGSALPLYSAADETLRSRFIDGISLGELKSDKSNKYKLTGLHWYYFARYLYVDGYLKNKGLTYTGDWKECMITYSDEQAEFLIRGAKNWLVHDENGKLVATDDEAKAGKFEIWAADEPEQEMTQVVYHETDGSEMISMKTPEKINLMHMADVENDGESYTFVGWSTDPAQAGYLSLDDSCNLYDFDDTKKVATIKPDVAQKFSLLGTCNPEKDDPINPAEYATNGELHLYPVYARSSFSSVATADSGAFQIVGIADYKDYEKVISEADNQRQKWLGKIYVNVYKDGEIWAESQEMYFRYHNDDAADVNIKFIDDAAVLEKGAEENPLMAFMCDQSVYPETSQVGSYRIDAVYATQGGSEDGLKYRYNWLSDNGGMLDNVAGGSTIDVYVTTVYQVKYYKNDELLTGAAWTDEGQYSTPGTENAFAEKAKNATYEVKMDNENAALMDGSIKDDSTFTDERLLRGEYSDFAYYIKMRPHTFDVAELPEPSAGKQLTGTTWQVKDEDGKVLLTQDPNSVFTLTGTSYGSGNTIYSYQGAEDRHYTYHLHVYEESKTTVIEKNPSKKPDTGDDQSMVSWVVLFGTALALLVVLCIMKKKK